MNFEEEQRYERQRRGLDDRWVQNETKYQGSFPTAPRQAPLTPEQQIIASEARMNNVISENNRRVITNIDRIDSTIRANESTHYVQGNIERTERLRGEKEQAEVNDALRESIQSIREDLEMIRDRNEALQQRNTTLEKENENLREQNFDYIEETDDLQDELAAKSDALRETKQKLAETVQKLRDATHTGEGFEAPKREAEGYYILAPGMMGAPTTSSRTNPMTVEEKRQYEKTVMFAEIYGASANKFPKRGR